MSRLLLTMLSAVAEFERDLIVERTKLGIERARERGKQIGRPIVPRPPLRAVRTLRAQGVTWPEIAEQFGCTIWAARQAATRGGGAKRSSRFAHPWKMGVFRHANDAVTTVRLSQIRKTC